MPYVIRKQGKKFCVRKQNKDGSAGVTVPGGCHPTRAEAEKHQRALYRNVPDAVQAATFGQPDPPITTPEQAAAPTSGPGIGEVIRLYFQEGELSVDGREIDPNSINFNRPPPLPIRLQLVQPESGGHAGAVLAGVITRVGRFGLTIVADAIPDLGSEAGRELLRLASPGPNGEPPILQTWSPDLGDVIAVEEVNAADEDGTSPNDYVVHIVEGTFLGATVAPLPALTSAVLEVLDRDGNVVVPAPSREAVMGSIASAILQGMESGSVHIQCPELVVALSNAQTVEISLVDGEVAREDFVASATTNENDEDKSFLQSFVLTADGKFFLAEVFGMNPDVMNAKLESIESEIRNESVHESVQEPTSQQQNVHENDDSTITLKDSVDASVSNNGDGRISKQFSSNRITDAASADAKLNLLLAQAHPATPISITAIRLENLEDGFARHVTEDSELSWIIPPYSERRYSISNLLACASGTAFRNIDGKLVGSKLPPKEFFQKPNLKEPQRWTTVTADGHVFGHLAIRDECHIGFLNQCVTIDEVIPGGFEYAMPGHVICADGSTVATGPLAVKGGHADDSFNWRQAQAHYDDPSSVVADVVYFEDEFGISYSGALRPTATEEQVYALRASGVSLDAREIGGQLRLIGACCVNVPGFPKVKVRVASAKTDEPRILTLVAAGGRPLPDPELIEEDCGCTSHSELEDRVRHIEAILAAAGVEDAAFERLTASIE